jgi:hypothetical protein
MKSGLYKLFTFSSVGTFVVLAGAAFALAATTIGTDVSTAGTLSVSGHASKAATTRLSKFEQRCGGI